MSPLGHKELMRARDCLDLLALQGFQKWWAQLTWQEREDVLQKIARLGKKKDDP